MEGSKELKGDVNWISEKQVPSSLSVDPRPPRETSSEAQDIQGASQDFMVNDKHASSLKPGTQQMATTPALSSAEADKP